MNRPSMLSGSFSSVVVSVASGLDFLNTLLNFDRNREASLLTSVFLADLWTLATGIAACD